MKSIEIESEAEAEAKARVELAACYRLISYFGLRHDLMWSTESGHRVEAVKCHNERKL